MVNTIDSTYTATINFSLSDGDVIQYRIKAMDKSVAQNVSYVPTSSTFYSVSVIGLGAPVDSYANNFNSATTDFFGDNLFTITTPAGFTDGCISTSHPYPQANPKDSVTYIFELKYPIRLKASSNANMMFKEIVLVEPGESGSTWPSSGFYDYVIVEGSKDGGSTWRKLINGYDSRDQSAWLTKWNSKKDANGNSTATATSSLYKTRVINMLATKYFNQGDEILIRFRLLSDQLAYGWGWAIDDLNIQTPITAIEDLPNQLSVYPNPVSTDYIHLAVPEGTKKCSFTMMNSLGQSVASSELDGNNNQQQIYVGNLHGGVYLMKIYLDQQVITKKMIVSR
jgi:hypothetical protein